MKAFILVQRQRQMILDYLLTSPDKAPGLGRFEFHEAQLKIT